MNNDKFYKFEYNFFTNEITLDFENYYCIPL